MTRSHFITHFSLRFSILTWVGLLSIGLQAQSLESLNWRWSHPKPHGNNILDMAQGNDHYIQVAERGQAFKSQDLELWTRIPSPTSLDFRGACFLNNRLIITAETGGVFFSNNLTTIVQGTLDQDTDAWLEGVAANSDIAIAVGDEGTIYRSLDGMHWTRVQTGFTTWLSDVAYGNGRFVAIGDNGLLVTSVDGLDWQSLTSPTQSQVYDIVWIPEQARFVAAGGFGTVLESPNGLQWSMETIPDLTTRIFTVTGNSDRTVVAGEQVVFTQSFSSEPTSWINQMDETKSFPASFWTYYSALPVGDSILLGGKSGVLIEGFWSDQTQEETWLHLDQAMIRPWFWDLKSLGDIIFAVGNQSSIASSVNGIDWTQEFPPAAIENEFLMGIEGNRSTLVAAGTAGTLLYSKNQDETGESLDTLGIEWDQAVSGTTSDLQGIGLFNNQFIVTGDLGTILSSVDGINWTQKPSGTMSFLTSVASSDTTLVVVGSAGTILTSPDGSQWTQRPLPDISDWVYRVRKLSDGFYAIGQKGLLLHSLDGLVWERRQTGNTSWLQDVMEVEGVYWIAGTAGTLLRSGNGLDWEPVSVPTGKPLMALAAMKNNLITTGTDGLILRARIAPFEAPVSILNFSSTVSETGTRDNLFLFQGEPDQPFSIQMTHDLENWSAINDLEIIDSNGVMIHLEPTSIEISNHSFFRTAH